MSKGKGKDVFGYKCIRKDGMQDIIVFGIGEAYQQRRHLMPANKYRIVEFWDNGASELGKKLNGIDVVKPHSDIGDSIVVVFSVHYYDEMKAQCIDELGIHEDRIKDYLLFEGDLLCERYKDDKDPYIEEFIDNIHKKGLSMFSYDWAYNYSVDDVVVEYDNECGLFYTVYENKRMYLSREYDTELKAKKYVLSLMIEQDPQSPHYYWKNDDWKDKTIIDLGAAEGNFALHMVDDIKEAIIVEVDEGWIEALNKTFSAYKDKIKIISKLVLDKENDNCTTLSNIITNLESFETKDIVIKLDIEGAEEAVLSESIDILSRIQNLHMLVCTYHHTDAYEYICRLMGGNGFHTNTVPGYMYMSVGSDNHRVQYKDKHNDVDLRHGLIYVYK